MDRLDTRHRAVFFFFPHGTTRQSRYARCVRGAASRSTSRAFLYHRQALMRTSPPIRTEMRGSASTHA